MSSDLVQKFPTLGECNRYTNGMCSTRSCLIRGGWKQGDAVDYDLATCETRDIRRTIEALEGEVRRLNNLLVDAHQHANKWMKERDKESARAERLRVALEPFARMGTERQPCDPAEGTMRMRVVTVPEIEAARKALEDDKQ